MRVCVNNVTSCFRLFDCTYVVGSFLSDLKTEDFPSNNRIMPLFGKKSDKSKSSPKEDKEDKKSSKVPTVEDKYILKDVLGT